MSGPRQTHYQERTLKNNQDVRAILSVYPNGKAIVFVHGFGGDPLTTWSEFHRILPGRSEFSQYDILFYGYDALYSELIASATLFQHFLEWIFSTRASEMLDSLPKGVARTFVYNEVIIVGHSLGAVLARWALLQATNEGRPWLHRVKLLLFAPAHSGARVVTLAKEVLGGFRFMSLIKGATQFSSPLVDQLQEGSRELTKLREDTEDAMQRGGNPHLIARKVVIAEYERIVSNIPFCRDPAPIPFKGTKHTTVCKPNPSFLNPLSALIDCL